MPMTSAAVLWLTAELSWRPPIVSATECPDVAQVERALTRLGADSTKTEARAWISSVRVVRSDSALTVEALDAAGATAAVREFPFGDSLNPDTSCEELATAVAISLLAWFGLPSYPSSSRVAPAASAPASPAKERSTSHSEAVGSPTLLQFGLAGGAGWQDSFSPALQVDAALIREALGLHVGLWLEADRMRALGPGSVSWNRNVLQLGFLGRLRFQRLALDLLLDAAVTRVAARGSGFVVDRNSSAVTLGASAQARLSSRFRTVNGFIGLAFGVWPRQQTLRVDDSSLRLSLPRTATLLIAGASFSTEVW